MRLYEISEELQKLFIKIENQGGELLPEDEAAWESLKLSKEEKVENTIKYIRNLESDSEALDNEIKRLQQKKSSLDNQIKNKKDYLGFNIGKGMTFKTPLFKCWWKECASVDVVNEEKIPDWYKKEETVISIDKKLIMQELKEEKEVPGARLIVNQHLQIK